MKNLYFHKVIYTVFIYQTAMLGLEKLLSLLRRHPVYSELKIFSSELPFYNETEMRAEKQEGNARLFQKSGTFIIYNTYRE